MDSLNYLFDYLAQRFRKENDLSDFTWAMCQASPYFKSVWIHFIFDYLDLNPNDIEYIEREVPDTNNSGSRVDFLLTKTSGEKYLIEVKLYDTNHHFGQYEAAYNVEQKQLGYITNYPHNEPGYYVKNWRDFYNVLLAQEGKVPEEEWHLISAYCEYLKNVCGFIMITEVMDLQKMTSLYDLTIILREIVEKDLSCEWIEVKNWNTSYRDNVRWFYLDVDYKQINGWGKQYPFIGIVYGHPSNHHETPYLYAGFDCRKGWSKSIVEYLNQNSALWDTIKLQYCSKPEPNGDLNFYMSDDIRSSFQNAKTIDEQKVILQHFLSEVLLFPVRLFMASDKDARQQDYT